MRQLQFFIISSVLLSGYPVWADDALVDELVVTANRTGAKLQDVASSLEVVTAEQLDSSVGVGFIDGLKKTPGSM